MKALIIAAGQGSRLNKISKDTPKALIPLLGLPLIERVILAAKGAGIREYVIVVGYLGDKTKETLGNGERFGVRIDYVKNEEWQEGNGVSVLKARELLNDNFVLLMSDHIFDVRILKELVNHPIKGSVILAVDRKDPLPGDTRVLEKNGKIVETWRYLDQLVFLTQLDLIPR